MLLVTFDLAVPVLAASSWNLQTVDKNATAEAGFIAVDSDNNPHIVYDDVYDETEYLMYASLNSSSWNIQTITSWYYAMGFAVDSNNTPHILCVNKKNGAFGSLTYVSWTGSNWTFQTVANQTTNDGFRASLALDSADNPHIAYLEINNLASFSPLKYATWTGSAWDVKTVDPDVSDAPINLALDSAGNAHIMYYVLQKLTYAVSTSTGWSKQTVNLNATATVGNMVLDSNGYPHFVYLLKPTPSYDYNTLMYASWDGSVWNTQTVASKAAFQNVGYLALDSHNQPHIDFRNGSALVYATWTGTIWNFQTVDPNNPNGPGPIVIDHNGNPHISYAGLQLENAMAYAMYATAAESTQTSSAFILLLVSTAVIVVAVVTVVYLWKKKT
jgi:hypothetical protein